MNRKPLLTAVSIASGLLLASACRSTAAREEEQAIQARREASEQTAEAQRDALKESLEAQHEADQAQREANQRAGEAQRAAQQQASQAQASAQEQNREAVQALTKQRDDYRAKAQRELDDLTNVLADLKAKAVKTSGVTQVKLNADIRQIEARRADVAKDISALGNVVTSAELERRASELDKRIADMRDSLREAEEKI